MSRYTYPRLFWPAAATTLMLLVSACKPMAAQPLADQPLAAELEATATTVTADGTAMEFQGTVEAQGPDNWTISGQIVAISAETEITGNPQVGDLVVVHRIRCRGLSHVLGVVVLNEPEVAVVELRTVNH